MSLINVSSTKIYCDLNVWLFEKDKILLRKKAIIETDNDELKNIAQVEHSRHRAIHNFAMNTISAIATYCFFPKKPMVNLERIPDNQLCLFWLFSSNSR